MTNGSLNITLDEIKDWLNATSKEMQSLSDRLDEAERARDWGAVKDVSHELWTFWE